MPRIIFEEDNQAEFLNNIQLISQFSSNQLGSLCGVSSRTFSDWLRGKYTISEEALLILSKKFQIPIPKNIKIVGDYWYGLKGASKGGLRRLELYGPLGTPEGRKKGGITSQLRRKEDPERYKLLGCNTRKEFRIDRTSVEFAEVAGIILGDGGITNSQLTVTLSSLVDVPYASYVQTLFKKVFGETPSWRKCVCCNSIDLRLSGVNLVQELERWGFRKGHKVKHQVGLPTWIWSNLEFQKACVRGLMDTDGGCYSHKHKVNGLLYRNFGMSFSNKSLPLIYSMAKILTSLRIKFSLARKDTQIYIYSFKEIKKYFQLINSHNLKNITKFNNYLNETTHRVVI